MGSLRASLVFVIVLPACNQLLGVTNPTPATGGDDATPGDDARPDTPMVDVPDIDAAPPCTTATAFGNPITSAVGGTGVALVTAKFSTTNDQNQDVAIAITTDTVILAGDGNGNFSSTGGQLLGTPATALAIEDFDIIGVRKDLLIVTPTSAVIRQQSESGGQQGVFLAAQPLSGSFANASLASVPRVDPTIATFSSRSVGEIGGNLVADVVIHDDAGNTPFTSNGTAGTFTRGTSVGAAGDQLVLVAQIDGANDADALLVDAAGNVKLALSDGADGLGTPNTVATGAIGGGVALGNFDDDALPDLVVLTAGGGKIFNQNPASPGTFVAGGVFTEISAAPFMIGDVNGDGLDDVVTPTAAVLQCPTTHAFTQKELIDATPPALIVNVAGTAKLDLLRLSGTDLIVRVQ